jgi:ABC-2 type transport system permease protein
MLLGVWVAWTILLPKVISNIAANAHPVPRWAEVEHRLNDEQGLTADSADPYEQRVEALMRDTLSKYGAKDRAELPVNFGGVTLLAGEDWGNQVFDRRFGALYQAYQAQDDMIRRWAWVTPLLALRAISMALSGTGLADELAFRRAAEAYRRGLVYRMNKAVLDHTTNDYTGDADLWRAVPPFHHAGPSALASLQQHAWDFAVLAAWLVVALMALIWATRRLDQEAVR